MEGNSLAPCESAPEAGVHVVWPDALASGVAAPARLAVVIPSSRAFSPTDPSRAGPHKYFVGEVYSGVALRAAKVAQLETEVVFLLRRLADRFAPLPVDDVTQVVGAAAIVFPVVPGSPRGAQVAAALQLVRDAAGPHLRRLMAAGRLLLILLSNDQAPATVHARDTSAALRRVLDAQKLLARRQVNVAERQTRRLAALTAVIEARLPAPPRTLP